MMALIVFLSLLTAASVEYFAERPRARVTVTVTRSGTRRCTCSAAAAAAVCHGQPERLAVVHKHSRGLGAMVGGHIHDHRPLATGTPSLLPAPVDLPPR